MSVWYCIPSKRPPEEAERCLSKWRERGYKIALFVDDPRDGDAAGCDFMVAGGPCGNYRRSEPFVYPGYAIAVNEIISGLMLYDLDAEWFVTGGDDVFPDPNHTAEEIAHQCAEYFAGRGPATVVDSKTVSMSIEQFELSRTFGVMQPTGDRWGDKRGAYIDRVCGSPWMGRSFCERVNQGKGPLWPEYYHAYEDEELQEVAIKLGVLWQRPDLTHHHEHWGRKNALRSDMPAFLEKANSAKEWNKAKEIFQRRQAAGFPGSEPIA